MAIKRKSKFDWMFWVGACYLIALVLFCYLYPIFGPPFDKQFGPFKPAGGIHLLGTDNAGLDVMTRLAEGGKTSLFIGFVVQGIALLVGITMGALGVFAPKWIRSMVLRFTDGMFAFPDILLAVLIIGFSGLGLRPVIIALSITAWPSITRLVVTQFASLKDREFVVAARAQGASTAYIIIKHILPQMWGILLAVTMINLAGTILSESTLSFLGIGIQDPDPSWGKMIDIGRQNMVSHADLLFWPCLILSATIFALNFVGDGLREALDPRSK